MSVLNRLLRSSFLVLALATAACVSATHASAVAVPSSVQKGWAWPTDGPRTVLAPYRAPAHAYGAGHRGIDVAITPGGVVLAPADGVVAFSGTVVDRALLTVEHPGGYVTTFEPVHSPLRPGDAVVRGDVLGVVSSGGHTAPAALHLGVRLDGAYVDPLLLYGEAERAVLLPCCAAIG